MNHAKLYPSPLKPSNKLIIIGNQINNIKLYSIFGQKLLDKDYNNLKEVSLNLQKATPGMYLVKVNDLQTDKLVIH